MYAVAARPRGTNSNNSVAIRQNLLDHFAIAVLPSAWIALSMPWANPR